MKQLEVTAIQRGCVYDGHGVRTTVFFRGCPFACPWCCNPETLYSSPSYFLNDDKCLKQKGIVSSLCSQCERNGGNVSLLQCPFGVYEPVSKSYDVHQLLKKVKFDKEVFRKSGGGVTLSGGDPLIHAEALRPFLESLFNERISCSIETTLYFKQTNLFESIIMYIKEWIVDLKLQIENYKADYLDVVSRNLTFLRQNGCDIRFRLVYVDTLKVENVLDTFASLNINAIEIIKCHALSKIKYQKLGLAFTDYSPSEENYSQFVYDLKKCGIDVNQLKI